MTDTSGGADHREAKSGPERLLDAAERLIAERGSAVSNREIIWAAGQRHNSAITYHFGSREDMVNAVWQRGSEFVNLRRAKILAETPRHDDDLRLLVDAWITPFTEYMDDRTPSYWARFNNEALLHYPQLIAPELRQRLGNQVDDVPLGTLLWVLEQMERHTRGGTQPVASVKVSTIVRGVVGTLAAWERDSQEEPPTSTATSLGQHLAKASLAFLQA